eukprot:TRINITY_DN10944_c0_g1_i7.p1 TRINITY_DN10944_c0_g1~~TRINITY_DN10944_c0_g1_i7.p1  ORF type:complete len:120 (+),score=19.38 TRINITY_DN10944_c0_g1_i7:80-439(+)
MCIRDRRRVHGFIAKKIGTQNTVKNYSPALSTTNGTRFYVKTHYNMKRVKPLLDRKNLRSGNLILVLKKKHKEAKQPIKNNTHQTHKIQIKLPSTNLEKYEDSKEQSEEVTLDVQKVES